MQHNGNGTREDLVLYRIETAKSDINSAKILLEAGEFRGANNRAYYGIYHGISAIHALDGNVFILQQEKKRKSRFLLQRN